VIWPAAVHFLAMSARSTFLAVLFLVQIGHGAGDSVPTYTVLSELSPRIAIRNITLVLPPRSLHVACQGDTLVLVRNGGGIEPAGRVSRDALELAFVVTDLVMGPGAGRAVVMIDEEAVAECPAQHCRVRLSARRVLAPPSSGKNACAGVGTGACTSSGALCWGGGEDAPSATSVRISLMAPETDLPTQPVVLGIQRSFSIALIDVHGDGIGLATESQVSAETGNTHKYKRLRHGEIVAADYCADAQEVEGAVDVAAAPSAPHHETGGGGGEPARDGVTRERSEVRREAGEGESSEAQHIFMRHLVRAYPEVRQLLEIGFHAGLSARAFLSARADVSMLSFDIGRHGHELVAWRAVTNTYPSRHTLVLGDSLTAVPAFHRHNPGRKFDLFYIDGGHTYRHAITDILNCRHLSNYLLCPPTNSTPSAGPQAGGRDGRECGSGALVLMDDLTPWVYWGVGPDQAWREAVSSGTNSRKSKLPSGFM
jgi:hypothetical protein